MLDTRLCGGSVYQGRLGKLGVCQAIKSWWLRTKTRLSWFGQVSESDGGLDWCA